VCDLVRLAARRAQVDRPLKREGGVEEHALFVVA
jgi:hypothetical protein